MKINFKNTFLAALAAFSLTGCVSDDDTVLPPYTPILLAQQFEGFADNSLLELPGWLNYAEAGNAKWKIQVYSDNGYAEFNPYASGDASNVGWLVSPEFTLEEGNDKKVRFQVSQSYVSSSANKLDVYISTNFDGTNVAAATWTPLEADIPGTDATYFEFQTSGDISLSEFNGPVHLAFKVTGSGTNTSLDGAYQIDNVTVY
jgi:Domain of unknown function (DUF5017)